MNNANIDSAANIDISKFAAGTNGYAIITVAGVPTWTLQNIINGTTITTAGGALPIGAVLRTTGVDTANWDN